MREDGSTLYEGLFKGIRDADQVSALVDAVSSGLRPRPHGQVVEQVAVVIIRIRRPEAAFGVPPCDRCTDEIRRRSGGRSGSNHADLVQRWEAQEAALDPWLWKKKTKKHILNRS